LSGHLDGGEHVTEPTTIVVSCAGFPGSGIQGDTIMERDQEG
jgi:hypothetical protein